MKLNTKVKAKAIDMSNKYNISRFGKDSKNPHLFARDYEGTNYRYSDNPFPTYIFEPDLLALEQRGNKDIEMYIEDIIEKTQLMIDDANDDLKDIANRLASKFEVKRNTAELDLARDLYTIALKDGYNSGFSMILEFDDLFIDGITTQQREYLENNIRSNAEMMMRSIAKKNGFVLATKNQNKFTKSEKMQDGADIKRNIDIDESLAKKLVNENLRFEDDYIVFKIEGEDFKISHRHPVSDYISDFDEYEGDIDELAKRISSGDLKEDIEKEMIGHTAFLEIFI